MESREKLLSRLPWFIAALAVVLVLAAWLGGPRGGFENLSAYSLFPLLGLVAFSLMWSHYMVGALRLATGVKKSVTKSFREITGWIVLAAILLHPSLLVYSLWRDGFGLPPDSYLNHYVAPSLKWAAMLGVFALLMFLAFELHHWFEDRKWWQWVERLSDVAMIFIIIHGLNLGVELQSGWFRVLWLFFAVTYFVALGYTYFRKFVRAADVIT